MKQILLGSLLFLLSISSSALNLSEGYGLRVGQTYEGEHYSNTKRWRLEVLELKPESMRVSVSFINRSFPDLQKMEYVGEFELLPAIANAEERKFGIDYAHLKSKPVSTPDTKQIEAFTNFFLDINASEIKIDRFGLYTEFKAPHYMFPYGDGATDVKLTGLLSCRHVLK